MRPCHWTRAARHGTGGGMEFWQSFSAASEDPGPPYGHRFPAPMPDGSRLWLPLRDYGAIAVTGFIANQASFAVVRALAGWMAEAARPLGVEMVCGLPTLGHVLAAPVAETLGHSNWVAAGYSRKRWYGTDAPSVPVSSSTATDERRIWLDPRVLHRLAGRRVLLVDDVISTGSSALAGLALLAAAGVRPVGLCVGMAQGDRWRASWPVEVPVAAGFATPLLRPASTGTPAGTAVNGAPGTGPGWVPDAATLPPVLLPAPHGLA